MKLRVLVSVVLAMFCVSTAAADTIVLRADEWCPYNCKPGAEKEGFMIDIAKAILGEAGHEVKYELQPWDKALDSAREGQIDGVVGGDEEDAAGFVFPKEATAINSVCYYSRKGKDWKFKDISSLEGAKLGVIEGYSYYPELDEFLEGSPKNVVKINGKEAGKDLASRLIRGLFDVIAENEYVAPDLFGKEMDKIEATWCGGQSDIFVAFSPHASKKAKSEGYAKLMTEGMQKMRKDGRLKKILDKYGIKDWKK